MSYLFGERFFFFGKGVYAGKALFLFYIKNVTFGMGKLCILMRFYVLETSKKLSWYTIPPTLPAFTETYSHNSLSYINPLKRKKDPALYKYVWNCLVWLIFLYRCERHDPFGLYFWFDDYSGIVMTTQRLV